MVEGAPKRSIHQEKDVKLKEKYIVPEQYTEKEYMQQLSYAERESILAQGQEDVKGYVTLKESNSGLNEKQVEENDQALREEIAELKKNLEDNEKERKRLAQLEEVATTEEVNTGQKLTEQKNSQANVFNIGAINKSRNERLSKEMVHESLAELAARAAKLKKPKRRNEILDMSNLEIDE